MGRGNDRASEMPNQYFPSDPRAERTTTGCPCVGIRRGNDPASVRNVQSSGRWRRRAKPSPTCLDRVEEGDARARFVWRQHGPSFVGCSPQSLVLASGALSPQTLFCLRRPFFARFA